MNSRATLRWTSSEYRELGIRSIVVLPVTMDETVLCALTVATLRETRRWDETFVQRLRLMSEIFANGLARKRAWQQQEERLQVERLIADLSAEFIKMPPDKVDASIDMGLRQVVASLPGVDRSTFVEFSSDRTQMSVTHSSARPGLAPYPPGRVNNVIALGHEQIAVMERWCELPILTIFPRRRPLIGRPF